MYKPDGQDVVTVMPAPGAPGAVNGWYTPGDPGSGVPASVVDPHWHNMLAAELLAILTAAGRMPDQTKTDYEQILASLNDLYMSGRPPLTAGTGAAYTVAGWAPLSDGQIYIAQAHADNAANCTLAGKATVNIDNTSLLAYQIRSSGVYYFFYQSAGDKFILLNPSQTSKILAIRSEPNIAPSGPATINNWYRIAASQSNSSGRGAREIIIANAGGTSSEYIRLMWNMSYDGASASIKLLTASTIGTNIKAIRAVYNASSQTAYLDIQAAAAFGNTLSSHILNDKTLGSPYFATHVNFTDVTGLPAGDSVLCTLNIFHNSIPIVEGFAYSGTDDAYRIGRDGRMIPGSGVLRLMGTSTGNANIGYMGFYQSDGTRDGYVGIGATSGRDIYLLADSGTGKVFIQSTSSDIVLIAAGSVRIGSGGPVVVNQNDAASQAEQEAASVTNKFVTPGRQQYHPSAAKMWARIDMSLGTPSIAISYNVSSITDWGTGDVQIDYSNPITAGGAVFAGVNGNVEFNTTSHSNGGLYTNIKIFDSSGAASDGYVSLYAATFGDL